MGDIGFQNSSFEILRSAQIRSLHPRRTAYITIINRTPMAANVIPFVFAVSPDIDKPVLFNRHKNTPVKLIPQGYLYELFREVSKSHQVLYSNESIIYILLSEFNCTVCCCCCEWVCNYAVSGFEADLRLKVVLTNRTNHL